MQHHKPQKNPELLRKQKFQIKVQSAAFMCISSIMVHKYMQWLLLLQPNWFPIFTDFAKEYMQVSED